MNRLYIHIFVILLNVSVGNGIDPMSILFVLVTIGSTIFEAWNVSRMEDVLMKELKNTYEDLEVSVSKAFMLQTELIEQSLKLMEKKQEGGLTKIIKDYSFTIICVVVLANYAIYRYVRRQIDLKKQKYEIISGKSVDNDDGENEFQEDNSDNEEP